MAYEINKIRKEQRYALDRCLENAHAIITK